MISNIFSNQRKARGYFRPQRLPNTTVETLLKLYPTDPRLGCPYNTGTTKFTSGALDKMACSLFGDIVQIGPARMIAQQLAKAGVPVYRYRFNHQAQVATESARGIGTGMEIPYVFSNVNSSQSREHNLAYQLTASWVHFAHDQDPNPSQGKQY